jgi:hypothetical protein
VAAYTWYMRFFRSRRVRVVFAACLALLILFAQGVRVQLHAHADSLYDDMFADAAFHAHVDNALNGLDHHDDTTTNVDIFFPALIKLLTFNPLFALVAMTLLLILALRRDSFVPSPVVRRYVPPRPYVFPPNRGPPR